MMENTTTQWVHRANRIALRIGEVIKQFNSLKNNIEVINLSAAEFDQMPSSDKDTKDRNEIR